MSRLAPSLLVALLALPSLLAIPSLLALPSPVSAQNGVRTDAELIQNALRAAPRSVTDEATVMDLGQNVLREGTNGWTCLPDDPNTPGDSPMCVDEPWLGFLEAYLAGEEAPEYSGVGISYMLRGDFPVSNVDPFAPGPTPDNEWIQDSGPHVMLLVSDLDLLEGLPTSPGDGPWVMWADTPYAHVMIPVPGTPRH